MGQEIVHKEEWVVSACNLDYNACGIRVKKENGIVVKIEGNPESAIGKGRLCPRGSAGLQILYDPNRVNKPLIRTNPEKGLNVDPKWKEISWDEAMNIIVEKLKEIRETDPRKLVMQGTTTAANTFLGMGMAFQEAFGTPNEFYGGGGLHCGNGAHLVNGVYHASWSLVPDFDYCNLAIYFGASKGHGAGHNANSIMLQAADARVRGMKFIVVDPHLGRAGAKADKWVPIIPGTDSALALGMVNLLINEFGVYDAEYLKLKTDAPYLVGPDRRYLRDRETGKPMIWDPVDERAKVYDDETIRDYALEGVYEVDGVKCKPVFQILKEHVSRYTPERVEEITTVPKETVVELAREFGEKAMIGSTITIGGKSYPYRPVAAIYFRGSQGHKNSVYNCISVELLNQIVGSADVPGGALGFNSVCFGYPETGKPRWEPKKGKDGFMMTGTWVVPHHQPFPIPEPRKPQKMGLNDLFPSAMHSFVYGAPDQEEIWQEFRLEYRPSVIINFGSNAVMSVGDPEPIAENLKKYDFIISFDIYLNEFTNGFADLVLPDACYLERLDPSPNYPPILNHPGGLGKWTYQIRQPVVKPLHDRRSYSEVLLEIAERLGLREALYETLNIKFELEGKYRLDPERKYTWEEICDLVLKNKFGDDKGLEWFKEHGALTWEKKPDEVYWRWRIDVRVPLYWEFLYDLRDKARKIVEELGARANIDWSFYEPLPDFKPCPSHEMEDEEYDLYGFYYREIRHTNSFTMQIPWLDEVSVNDPYTYNIEIHPETARKKGLKDGDLVWVENPHGSRVKGRIRFTEGIHPKALGFAACAGHWCDCQPIAKGKGIFFNKLLRVDWNHVNPVNLNLDLCVKLKIYRAE